MKEKIHDQKVKEGYRVLSEKSGKDLGGPYKTKAEAKKRLQQSSTSSERRASAERRAIQCSLAQREDTRGVFSWMENRIVLRGENALDASLDHDRTATAGSSRSSRLRLTRGCPTPRAAQRPTAHRGET